MPGPPGVEIPGERDGLVDKELGAVAGNEHPRLDGESAAGKLRPAEDVLQRLTGDASGDQHVEIGRVAGIGQEQLGLILGEDTSGGPQPLDHHIALHRSATPSGRRGFQTDPI